MSAQVEIKEVAPLRVFSRRGRVRMSEIGKRMTETFGAMLPHLSAHGASVAGPPLSISYDEPQPDGTIDLEICLPIDRDVPPLDGMASRMVDGGLVAATIHQGSYRQISSAYDRLFGWLRANGYAPVGAPREIYLNDPGAVKNPADLLTELVVPVRKIA